MKKQIKYISAGMLAGMLHCGREGNSPCTETFEECEVGMDVYQLFPEYTGHYRTFP